APRRGTQCTVGQWGEVEVLRGSRRNVWSPACIPRLTSGARLHVCGSPSCLRLAFTSRARLAGLLPCCGWTRARLRIHSAALGHHSRETACLYWSPAEEGSSASTLSSNSVPA